MTARRDSSFQPHVFPAGALKQGLASLAEALLGDGAAVETTIFERLPDGTKHSRHNQTLDSLATICDLPQQRITLGISLGVRVKSAYFSGEYEIQLGTADEYLEASFTAPDPEALMRLITAFPAHLGLKPAPSPSERYAARSREEAKEREARLEEVRARTREEVQAQGPPPIWKALDSLADRVARLESATRGFEVLTCFISFQFTGTSLGYGTEVKEFLQLLGLNVLTGQGYEPKPISDKVRSRLAGSVDIVVVLEVAGSKSSWTRDEIAKAQQPGVYLIPLVESGASFDRGIFGDHEYITFDVGHVSGAFVRLLEGVRYVARERATALLSSMPPTA